VQVKKQLEEEISLLTQNFGQLKVAHNRYIQSLESIDDVSKSMILFLYPFSESHLPSPISCQSSQFKVLLPFIIISCLINYINVYIVCIGTSGQECLVPLTSSVYVKGRLTSNENLLVDVGTGYITHHQYYVISLLSIFSYLISIHVCVLYIDFS